MLPKAPGTFGTLVGVPLVWWLAQAGITWQYYIALTIAVTIIGTIASSAAEKELGKKDPGCVVVDELAGYMVTMAFVPITWWTLAGGFILFRIFDILKPPPIGMLDKKVKGGWGIMVDDLAAGAIANGVLQLCLLIATNL
jgi:phosphatidylglycerophosphatase A